MADSGYAVGTVIELQGVSRQFGVISAVRNVSFRLEQGEITGLLGPNGAGKTTTIRMMTGYLAPTSGKVTVAGFDMATDVTAARARMGYLPEATPLYPEMRVEDYITYRATLAGLARRERHAATGRELDRCLLQGVREQRIGTLSKGFRQRVGLAGALVHDPDVVILDEPGNGLDPNQIVQFRSVVTDLARSRTMVISSHILSEVERVCSRVLVIAGGELLADRPIGALAGGPGHIVASCAAADGDRLRTAMAARGWKTETIAAESGEYRMAVRGTGCQRAQVAAAARAAQVELTEVREEKPTLERAFLEILQAGGSAASMQRGVA